MKLQKREISINLNKFKGLYFRTDKVDIEKLEMKMITVRLWDICDAIDRTRVRKLIKELRKFGIIRLRKRTNIYMSSGFLPVRLAKELYKTRVRSCR